MALYRTHTERDTRHGYMARKRGSRKKSFSATTQHFDSKYYYNTIPGYICEGQLTIESYKITITLYAYRLTMIIRSTKGANPQRYYKLASYYKMISNQF